MILNENEIDRYFHKDIFKFIYIGIQVGAHLIFMSERIYAVNLFVYVMRY